ncbi:uncharacterized protein BCR38DRAFT_414013 [Pseudomassariella vexata]|uniref:Uncharacterized protein n=1 Tax=Pseudomassariella vexata TaxID=1141098 RepID=A0A1Y2DD14_9PEZI|nr:uncharacterized protein BCR38DRAFT_414013 [Pseudomassariella vexata]ORY57161.1 hypothetical protein BCR38DRAFT_414013 [Pseudomassariella vexata]
MVVVSVSMLKDLQETTAFAISTNETNVKGTSQACPTDMMATPRLGHINNNPSFNFTRPRNHPEVTEVTPPTSQQEEKPRFQCSVHRRVRESKYGWCKTVSTDIAILPEELNTPAEAAGAGMAHRRSLPATPSTTSRLPFLGRGATSWRAQNHGAS